MRSPHGPKTQQWIGIGAKVILVVIVLLLIIDTIHVRFALKRMADDITVLKKYVENNHGSDFKNGHLKMGRFKREISGRPKSIHSFIR